MGCLVTLVRFAWLRRKVKPADRRGFVEFPNTYLNIVITHNIAELTLSCLLQQLECCQGNNLSKSDTELTLLQEFSKCLSLIHKEITQLRQDRPVFNAHIPQPSYIMDYQDRAFGSNEYWHQQDYASTHSDYDIPAHSYFLEPIYSFLPAPVYFNLPALQPEDYEPELVLPRDAIYVPNYEITNQLTTDHQPQPVFPTEYSCVEIDDYDNSRNLNANFNGIYHESQYGFMDAHMDEETYAVESLLTSN
ncbi:hypothetical protein Ciccas_008927 [Cichlidogyrus casuarinus]|uniref:Uncharacterized protein n=1 Tax=Cichlidogyrus casuarinus TaxID=1844966 RepID=A0ABD2Q182_9PLAT